MTRRITRIALRFESRLGIIHDDDALGIWDFDVSVQGRSFRPHRNGDGAAN